MITQKKLKQIVHYDEQTGIFTRLKNNKQTGSLTKRGYLHIGINNKRYYAHRLAWLYVYGNFPKHMIDHINGNPLDNKISNLRDVQQVNNMMNYKLPVTNTSGVKGVTWHKVNKKWRVRFKVNKKDVDFGLFDDFELASLVAVEARTKYHNEFAREC
jgi:hypothetical protein